MENEIPYHPSNRLFEPTISILKNALLVNYKKVGTRYFSELSSLPNLVDSDRKQIDLQMAPDCSLDKNDELYTLTQLKFPYKKHHVYTPWDMNSHFLYSNNLDWFPHWNSSKEFLSYLNCSNYNKLLFENKDRDIVFIVRNPLLRIVSGVTQITLASFDRFVNDSELRDELKFYTKLTDLNIKNVIKYSNTDNLSDVENKLEHDSLSKIFQFIVEKKWDWIFQDIHTENYLSNYIEWIYNIKNKNRLKIIDLKDCRSNKSLQFFSELRGDDVLEKNWEHLSKAVESNKTLYNLFLKNYVLNGKIYDSPLHTYLKSEYIIYNQLIESPYYVDLKD